MTPFHVGMKVVCVDDRIRTDILCQAIQYDNNLDGLKLSCPYTVRAVGPDRITGQICLWLEEIVRPIRAADYPIYGNCDVGYHHSRFRPVHETRMEELRSLLLPTPAKQKERV